MRRNLVSGGAAALVITLVAACSSEHGTATAPLAESPSTIVAPATQPALAKAAKVPKLVLGLQWRKGLPSHLQVSQVIGPDGGLLSIPQAGVTVIVPAGALTFRREIKLSIHTDKVVSYDFEPHGITFQQPLTLHQDLSFTNATAALAPVLNLGYYASPLQVGTKGAEIDEENGGWSNMARFTFSAHIWHFSGYMVACGRGEVL